MRVAIQKVRLTHKHEKARTEQHFVRAYILSEKLAKNSNKDT